MGNNSSAPLDGQLMYSSSATDVEKEFDPLGRRAVQVYGEEEQGSGVLGIHLEPSSSQQPLLPLPHEPDINLWNPVDWWRVWNEATLEGQDDKTGAKEPEVAVNPPEWDTLKQATQKGRELEKRIVAKEEMLASLSTDRPPRYDYTGTETIALFGRWEVPSAPALRKKLNDLIPGQGGDEVGGGAWDDSSGYGGPIYDSYDPESDEEWDED